MATNGKINFGRGARDQYVKNGVTSGFSKIETWGLVNSTDTEMIYFAEDTQEVFITKDGVTKAYGLSDVDRMKLEKSFTNIEYNEADRIITLTRTNPDVTSAEALSLNIIGEDKDRITLPRASSTHIHSVDVTQEADPYKYVTQEVSKVGGNFVYSDNEVLSGAMIDQAGLMTPNQVKELRMLREDLGLEIDARIEGDRVLQVQIDNIYGYDDYELDSKEQPSIPSATESKDSITIEDINDELDVVDVELNDLKEDLRSIRLRKLTNDELSTIEGNANIKEAYRIVSIEHNSTGNGKVETGKDLATNTEVVHESSEIIKIYKDQNLVRAYLGSTGDTINSATGEVTLADKNSYFPDKDNPGAPSDDDSETITDALCFVYQLADGTYSLVTIPVGSFLRESEFKHGLGLNLYNQGDNTVTVKLSGTPDPTEEISWWWDTTNPNYYEKLKDSKSEKYLVFDRDANNTSNSFIALRSDLIDDAIFKATTTVDVAKDQPTIEDGNYSADHVEIKVEKQIDEEDGHTNYQISWTEKDIASEFVLTSIAETSLGLTGDNGNTTGKTPGYQFEYPATGLSETTLSDGTTEGSTHLSNPTKTVKNAIGDLDASLVHNDVRTALIEKALTGGANVKTENGASGIEYKIAALTNKPTGYTGTTRLCLEGTDRLMGNEATGALENLDYQVTDNHVHLCWIDR